MAVTTEVGTQRRLVTIYAVVSLVLAAVIIFLGNYDLQPGDNGGLGPAIVTAVGCLVVAAIIYAVALPRTRRPDRTALILGILAVLSIVVFWSGVTPVLAGGALAVTGGRGEVSRTGRVAQIAAVVATVLVLVVSFTQTRVF
jgi:hypothetical protein